MTTEAQKPLRVFCSYSRKDERYLNDLRDSLRGLEQEGLIEWWHDREIVPGWEWEEDIDKHLRTADVILLLVSRPFMASKYVYEKEIRVAVERHERGEARVIPIIIRPTDWQWAAFGKLQALPEDAKPITEWSNRDRAWLNVVIGVRRTVNKLRAERQEQAAKDQYRKAVKKTWTGQKLTSEDTVRLDTLARELGLSTDAAADVERDITGATKEAVLERQERAAREKERKERLARLYAEARRLHRDQQWQAVVDVFKQIRTEEPDYPDSEGLLQSAREVLKVEERRKILASLLERQEQVLLSLDMINWVNVIYNQRKHLLAEYKVLVIGEFNTGKSTLINALLGKEVLPAYATPTTAIITEVKWGDNPRAVLHFRSSEDGGAPPPKEVPVEELEDYLVIKDYLHKEEEIREPSYEKVELFYPLELCRNGVEVIDSPGLNDSEVQEEITLKSLGAVEAVLFVMSAIAPGLSQAEELSLRRIRAAGHQDIFFVYNRINQIYPDELEMVKQHCVSRIETLIGQTDNRIFFINALGALRGHVDNDPTLLEESGVPQLEIALKPFLMEEKRERTKILRAINELKESIGEAQRAIAQRKGLLKESLGAPEDASKRESQAEADPSFRKLALARSRLNEIDSDLNDLIASVEWLIRSWLPSSS